MSGAGGFKGAAWSRQRANSPLEHCYAGFRLRQGHAAVGVEGPDATAGHVGIRAGGGAGAVELQLSMELCLVITAVQLGV